MTWQLVWDIARTLLALWALTFAIALFVLGCEAEDRRQARRNP